MKTTINLYLDELRPKKQYLTPLNFTYAALLSVAFALSYFAVLNNEVTKTEQDLAKVQNLLTQSQKLLVEKQKSLVIHNDKATFNNQKLSLQQKLKARQLLWNGVGKRLEASTVDYFSAMNELTLHHSHELWLSEFSFNDDNVIFYGYALSSTAVTTWMTYLQSSKSFKGREFSHIDIKAVSPELVSFQIATSASLIKTPELEGLEGVIGG